MGMHMSKLFAYRGHDIEIEVDPSKNLDGTWGGGFSFRESGSIAALTKAALSRREVSLALAQSKTLRYAKQMIDTKLALAARD